MFNPRGMKGRNMTIFVEYNGISTDTDELIGEIVGRHGGTIVGSGFGFGTRDLEIEFLSRDEAYRAFDTLLDHREQNRWDWRVRLRCE